MQRHKIAFTICLGLAVTLFSSAALAQYQLTNLDSNQAKTAKFMDPLQVNGWGLARSSGGPFWVSDQGSGWSTIYTGKGVKEGLEVLIPTASGAGPGQPTGIVLNGSSDFQVQGWPAIFLFATLDGTISGWAPQSNPNDALIAVDNSKSGAVYTGLAITNKASGNFLYAADNANNKVDVFDGNFNPVPSASFTDPALPAGFAPFGIQDIEGLVYVAYAGPAEAAGGYIDIFREDGTLVGTFFHGAPLNQPWGMTMAPANFGPLSNTLLISNNTDTGTINAFSLNNGHGQFVGTVKDTNGKDIVINQLWGIEFGGGAANNGKTNQLFFTSGPYNNLAGTFGVIAFK
ncbi:MAG TPA: TIGR03118 family protein [Terriglobales bacterium]|nr:TIGR03118 family protein [Terriglobales bacterium]